MQVRKVIFVSVVALSLVIITPGFAENVPASSSPASAGAAVAADPLLQLLVSKGVLNADEAKSLTGTPEEQRTKLLELLREKGILSASDFEALAPASAQVASNLVASTTPILPGSNLVQSAAPKDAPAKPGPKVIPAVAPVRVLPIDSPKQGGLIPDIHLGSGANMKLYGFFKSTAVEDTASSGGGTFGSQDWPLPLLIGGDTGPTSDPSFHIKARSARFGSLFGMGAEELRLHDYGQGGSGL